MSGLPKTRYVDHISHITKASKRDAQNLKQLSNINHSSVGEAIENNEICKDHGLPLTLHCNSVGHEQLLCMACAMSGHTSRLCNIREIADRVKDIKEHVTNIKGVIQETQDTLNKVSVENIHTIISQL